MNIYQFIYHSQELVGFVSVVAIIAAAVCWCSLMHCLSVRKYGWPKQDYDTGFELGLRRKEEE